MPSNRIRWAGAAVLAIATTAGAQTWPTKPVTVITPLQEGGPYTIVLRGLLESLGQTFGKPLLMDSRLGGEGVVGMQACAKAPADGYSFCYPNSTIFTVNPIIYTRLPYDPLRDFTPVAQVGFVNSLLIVNPALPVKSLADLVTLARSKPDSLAYGTFGYGNLLVAWMKHATGASFLSVPYKGAPQATTAVVAGEVQVSSNSIGVVQPLIKAGKVRALAVTGNKRSTLMPDVPSFKDFDMELDLRSWAGLFAPAGTPREVITRLNVEVNRLLADAKFQSAFLSPSAVEPAGGSVEEFAEFVRKDREAAAQLVKLANIKPQ